MIAPAPPSIFRAEALDSYRSGHRDLSGAGLDAPPRWPMVALTLLVLALLGAAAVIRVPTFAEGFAGPGPGGAVIAVLPAPTGPAPAAGQDATLVTAAGDSVPLRVSAVVEVSDRAAALRWSLPDTLDLPVTVVTLEPGRASAGAESTGRVRIRTSAPTVLRWALRWGR